MPVSVPLEPVDRADEQPVYPLGDRLRRARLAQGLSQKKFGERMELSDAAVCQLETGRTRISVQQLLRWAELTEVAPEALLSGLQPEPDASGSDTPSELVRLGEELYALVGRAGLDERDAEVLMEAADWLTVAAGRIRTDRRLRPLGGAR